MKVRTWVEFTRVDERVTRFAGGLLTDRSLYPDAAVIVNQERVADLDLPPSVPEGVRHHFEAARQAYCYGVFAYDLFNIAVVQASLSEEFALSERYLALLPGPVSLTNERISGTAEFMPTRFGDLQDVMRRDGKYPRQLGWRIVRPSPVPTGLNALLQWARTNGVLDQWLDRRWEIAAAGLKSTAMMNELPSFTPIGWIDWDQARRDTWWAVSARGTWEEEEFEAIRNLRNAAAHPDYATIRDPATSAHRLRSARDFIAALWGALE
ncbi:MAG: hypothetical protein M3451_07560 [Chloroflexota bacterium]|nr:hypothetical protein [Chloroflexota bacterium]